ALKTLTIGINSGAPAMGVMGPTNTNGGWYSVADIHSNGLTTTDVHSRTVVGRLVTKVPSLDDGSISVLPDCRKKEIYSLRPGITWQDGAPFTANDLVFSLRFNADRGLPTGQQPVITVMDSAEAPDASTFVLYYKTAYFLGGALGTQQFWPQPAHLLSDAYDRYLTDKDSNEVANLPYWSSDYVHLGPFRMTTFDPAEGFEAHAYDGYFL